MDSGDQAPWSAGVSEAAKLEAERLLAEGNTQFVQSNYKQALATYRKAIASWDHPAIRFNVVRTLINLDRPIEAYENLELALKYGERPLEADVYREALNYRKLLRGQIADLEVTCEQAGVVVSIDGDELLECPGSRSLRMKPGTHAIVGKKREFLTSTQEVVLVGGSTKKVAVSLISIEDATVTKRRFDRWKPWTVVAGGAVTTGIGALLFRQARTNMDKYEAALADACPPPDGCRSEQDISEPVRDIKSRAELQDALGIATMITGGVALVGGLTLVILNRPRPVVVEKPRLAPAIQPGQVGFELTIPF